MYTHSLALEARNLQVQIGEHCLLAGVDLRVRAHCWTAIVGPNGAGKSTLLQSLAGLQPAVRWRGEVRVLGRPLETWSAREQARAVSWLGQNAAASSDLRCYDVVMLGRLPHQAWLAPPSVQDAEEVRRAMEATTSWAWRDRRLSELSGGERQRVLLARALAVQASVLLMDEPLANLDPPHQSQWMATVRAAVQAQRTVVSVLHEIGIALHSDDLVVMANGSVVHHGPTRDARTREALAQVFEHRIRLVEVEGQWVAIPVV